MASHYLWLLAGTLFGLLLSAIIGPRLRRWLRHRATLARDNDLDRLIEDHSGLKRKTGESDREYRARAGRWMDASRMGSGSLECVRLAAENVDGVVRAKAETTSPLTALVQVNLSWRLFGRRKEAILRDVQHACDFARPIGIAITVQSPIA